ncbi:MAG: hypothetical protein Q4C42_04510 [Clostridia bacterium]|nr:hypothetical protein [Clostridia bacterium]
MASSNKTENLELNLWEATDCPERADFVRDNMNTEAAVSEIRSELAEHKTAENTHLTAQLIAKINSGGVALKTMTYSGTGGTMTNVSLGFAPKAVWVYALNEPTVKVDSGNVKIYSGMASSLGNGGGMALSGSTLRVYQNRTATNGVIYSLNESGVSYAVIGLA